MDEETVVRSNPGSGGQWLHVWMEERAKARSSKCFLLPKEPDLCAGGQAVTGIA